jgi:hypothetical protein
MHSPQRLEPASMRQVRRGSEKQLEHGMRGGGVPKYDAASDKADSAENFWAERRCFEILFDMVNDQGRTGERAEGGKTHSK